MGQTEESFILKEGRKGQELVCYSEKKTERDKKM